MARFEEAALEAVAFLAWWMSGHRALALPLDDAARWICGADQERWDYYTDRQRTYYRDKARTLLEIIARKVPIYEDGLGDWHVVDGAG